MKRILFLALFLSGCQTFVIDGALEPDAATVIGKVEGVNHFMQFVVVGVDGKTIEHASWANPWDALVMVPPGERRFVIKVDFNDHFGTEGLREAVVPLTAVVEANVHYQVDGEPRGDLFFVWLKEVGSDEKATAEGSATYVHKARDPGSLPLLFIPVIGK